VKTISLVLLQATVAYWKQNATCSR